MCCSNAYTFFLIQVKRTEQSTLLTKCSNAIAQIPYKTCPTSKEIYVTNNDLYINVPHLLFL